MKSSGLPYASANLPSTYESVIPYLKALTSHFTQSQKYRKVAHHIQDSLNYKTARPFTCTREQEYFQRKAYQLHTSTSWQTLTYWLGIIFVYLIIWSDSLTTSSLPWFKAVETILLLWFWADFCLEAYYVMKISQKWPIYNQNFNLLFLKLGMLLFSSFDTIILLFEDERNYSERSNFIERSPGAHLLINISVRPFLITRFLFLIVYDRQMRNNVKAFLSAWKDILVFAIFFWSLIFAFSVVGAKMLSTNEGQDFDEYKQNYNDLGKMVFVMYITATYDSFPDNQQKSLDNNQFSYFFFIFFIFFNMFVFTSVPGSLVYETFRETMGKIVIKEQIQQQHSLVLAFMILTDQPSIQIQELINALYEQRKLAGNEVHFQNSNYSNNVMEICKILDQDNSGSIELKEFLQLSKILLERPDLLLDKKFSFGWWEDLRKWINSRIRLADILNSLECEICISILILLSILNAILFLIYFRKGTSWGLDVLDFCFVIIFGVELWLKLIAFGVNNYLEDIWNKLDFFIITLSIFFVFFVPPTPENKEELIRLLRIFRLSTPLKTLPYNFDQLALYLKLKNLLTNILIIFPILLRFIPMFLAVCYILGVFGMRVFYEDKYKPMTSYGQYDKYSNFQTFLKTQFMMVQILLEAGWSTIAYDHAKKNQGYFFWVMMLFVLYQMIIVLILSTLLRGIFWEVYFMVQSQQIEFNRFMNLKLLQGRPSNYIPLQTTNPNHFQTSMTNRQPLHRQSLHHPRIENIYESYVANNLRRVKENTYSNPFLTHQCQTSFYYLNNLKSTMNMAPSNTLEPPLNKLRLHPEKIVRDIVISPLSQSHIDKYQTQFMYNQYGESFYSQGNYKIDINRVKYKALLLFNLRSAFRYQQTPSHVFYEILLEIQKKISKKILKYGSLFKFIFQDSQGAWFTLAFQSEANAKKIVFRSLQNQHAFIWQSEMIPGKVYYSQDFFSSAVMNQISDESNASCLKLKKDLNSFWDCLSDVASNFYKNNSFEIENVNNYNYDVYTWYLNFAEQQINSRVMILILSKEKIRERKKCLSEGCQNQKVKNLDEEKEDDDPETMQDVEKFYHLLSKKHIKDEKVDFIEKLKEKSPLIEDMIIDEEGLSHPYILELFQELHEILQLKLHHLSAFLTSQLPII